MFVINYKSAQFYKAIMAKSFFDKLTGTAKTDKKISPDKVQHYEEDQEIDLTPKTSQAEWDEISQDKLEESEGQLAIDVYQTESDILIKSTIAGVNSDDLDISITNDMVTIRGKRTKEDEVAPENYYYQECYWGPFSRSIILPVEINAEKAQASIKDGVLTIRLPKAEKMKTRKIKVETDTE